MTRRPLSVQQRYLDLVDKVEQRFDVADWRSGDIDLWPLARMDLFLDMFRASGGDTARPRPPAVERVARGLATPLINAWKSRRDLEHWLPWPKPADAILLGDGVSLDKISGAWRDRHGEAVMAALERQGRTTFLMQPGGLDRLPWARPTFAANGIAVRGALAAALGRKRPLDLPDHAAVLALLSHEGVQAPSLSYGRILKRACTTAATAVVFQRILRRVRPRLAFVVTYYAGLGHAFALACRREGVMCVDLQHCPQEGTHRAYRWRRLPERGYSTLPAVFWTWTPEDADNIARWSDLMAAPWHAAVHGGHSQLAPYLDDWTVGACAWDERFSTVSHAPAFEREILVALQPIGGRRAVWEALARQIQAAPATWRWWIRRHPASSPFQDAEHHDLLAIQRPNVVVEAASEFPLPALLRRMSVLVSLASGAAAEAAAFGVPALFLDQEALGAFQGLIARGQAELVDVADVASRIADLRARPVRAAWNPPPPIEDTLRRLDAMAAPYRRRQQSEPLDARRRS
jgi:hypothetical protein